MQKLLAFGLPYENGFLFINERLYDDQGNIKRGMSSTERKIYDNLVTTTAIPIAAPFAVAQGLPPQVWNAISILLKAGQ